MNNNENKNIDIQSAIFAAGCFWHIEHEFSPIKGVISVTSGYTGGKTIKPTYKMVCSGSTGHAEAIKIEFDPNIVSYIELLDKFFSIHDPTQLNKQGPDIGNQYRSEIFTLNKIQLDIANSFIKKLQSKFNNNIVTKITNATAFYPAEDYHQEYYKKHNIKSCHI